MQMKRIMLCTLSSILFVLPVHADSHSQPTGVIYYCGTGDVCRRVGQNGSLLLCPVPCETDDRMGDFHSFELDTPERRQEGYVIPQEEYVIPRRDWVIETPQIFPHGPSELPGSVWTPSPAERYLHDMGSMGVPGQ